MYSRTVAEVSEQLIEKCHEMGLTIREMGPRSGPTFRHWHVQRTDMKGTLEVTYQDGVVTFQVRSNRAADWVKPAGMEIAAALTGNGKGGLDVQHG